MNRMFERLKAEEEARLGRPLSRQETGLAAKARLEAAGGKKAQKRAMRKAIRYGGAASPFPE